MKLLNKPITLMALLVMSMLNLKAEESLSYFYRDFHYDGIGSVFDQDQVQVGLDGSAQYTGYFEFGFAGIAPAQQVTSLELRFLVDGTAPTDLENFQLKWLPDYQAPPNVNDDDLDVRFVILGHTSDVFGAEPTLALNYLLFNANDAALQQFNSILNENPERTSVFFTLSYTGGPLAIYAEGAPTTEGFPTVIYNLEAIPEPGAVMLLGLAATALMLLRNRWRGTSGNCARLLPPKAAQ